MVLNCKPAYMRVVVYKTCVIGKLKGFFYFRGEDYTMTCSINFYLPETAWGLIFEFHNAAPLRQEKRTIALLCKKLFKSHCIDSRWCPEWSTKIIDKRSRPFMLRNGIQFLNMEWDYEELHRWGQYHPPFINIFNSPSFRQGWGWEGLPMQQFRKLLKMNGVKDVYEMNRKDLVHAYLAL